jgi:putative transposase
VFEKAWVRALNRYDKLVGINWNWLSMDGAMSKAPLGGKKSGPNPTDRAKSGTKRSVITESAGIPLGLAVDGANVVDFKLARDTIASIPIKRPRPTPARPQGVCLDKGYDYREVDALLREFRFTGHIARRGQNARKLKRSARHKARRWVVERTHSWMNRFRRILVRWEKRADTYVALLHLVFALITWRTCAAFA